MYSSTLTTSRCLLALIFATTAFFALCFYMPQLIIVPAMSISATFFQQNLSTTEAPSKITPYSNGHPTTVFKAGALSLDVINRNTPTNQADLLKHLAILNKVIDIDCPAIFEGIVNETLQAKTVATNVSEPISDLEYLNLTIDCKTFQSSRGYILSSLTKEEEDFPIAFSLLVFKEVEMVERLLKAIYRPQNYYCIHVDSKAPDVFYRAVSSIAKCFPNVFLTSRRIDVQWGWFSVLEPELQCMEELWRYPRWKYFMSLTGQEFPLKTNFELVKILTAYGGANDIEGTIKRANHNRWRSPPPAGIRAVKGSVHITVNRDFVDFILHNKTSKLFLEWAKLNTSVPDETFFASLNHNPQLGIRGTYKGEPETDDTTRKPFLTRYKNWGSFKCSSGQYVRGICILSLGDLPQLSKAKHYFANKFYLQQDRVVIGCLEEKIFNDTRDEYLGVKQFDVSYYANLGFVKDKV